MTVSQLPSNITFDLNSAKRPEKDVKPIFRALVLDREITMLDPATLDWRDLLLLESPVEFLRLAIGDADRKWLLEQSLEGWQFESLMEAYYRHYDLEEKQREARRKQQLAGI
jgi:hypothetical protein